MSPYLELDGAALDSGGQTISLRLAPRHSLSLFGPAAAGKTQFLRVLAGLDKPSRGQVKKAGKAVLAGPSGLSRRATPLSLAQAAAAKGTHHAAEALSALGLWDARKTSLSGLSPGQQGACLLLEALSCSADLLLIDGLLDGLDPWAYRDVLALLQKRVSKGAILAVATNRPEWAALTDSIVVLRDRHVLFSGAFDELERKGAPSKLTVETNNREGVRAICEPFGVHISEGGGKVELRSQEGQELAARLLLAGYGDVRSVILRQPGPRELLEGLMR